ncbi:MAG: PrgI family protein [Candidatus Levyibacteriota bacterium]
MEGHPIPQDITGFQFKLIGDMTIKQFAYLACGAVLAWIFYALPLPGIIKLPISAFFALAGVGFAFFPISGRPMDIMAVNFIKALFTPSQYVYQKTGGSLSPIGFMNAEEEPKNEVDKKEMVFFSSLFQRNQNNSQPQAPRIITSEVVGGEKPREKKEPASQEGGNVQEKEEHLAQEEQVIKKELQEAKTQEEAAVNTPSSQDMHQKVLELEKILNETTAQRQELERQILELQKKLNNTQPQNALAFNADAPKKETKNVRSIPSALARSTGVPIAPDFPNLLTGIVKDPRGNPLPNILVEVKDKERNPVRAFKTNGLGQFASATALANGIYDIVFEDPRGQHKFDIVEINATGEIILPLEIISQDAREELRKSLFSAQGGSATGGN